MFWFAYCNYIQYLFLAQAPIAIHPTTDSENSVAAFREISVNGIDGNLVIEKLTSYLRVSYSPYVCGSFYSLERDSSGDLIKSSIKPFTTPEQFKYAIVNGADVILTNDKLN